MLVEQELLAIVREGVDAVAADISGSLPQLAAGIVFLLVAGIGVKLGMVLVGRGLRTALPGEENIMYRRVIRLGTTVFVWFGVVLAFLSIVGLQELAAALGSATGFVALGVSYALKDMVSDAVAGVYLLRDPDFMPGDTVTSAGVTGEVEQIELRKTRIRTENDDLVVVANGKLESEWTRHAASDTQQPATHD